MRAPYDGQKPYQIRGFDDGHPNGATRLRAVSALSLAKRWIEAGLTEVRIVDQDGHRWTVDEFWVRTIEMRRRHVKGDCLDAR